MKNVFVAVATGQNISNFPPLLQFAEPGDHVLWLVSNDAKSKNWLKGSCEILKSRGMTMEEVRVDDLYSPQDVSESTLAKDCIHSCEKLYFILNGGPKLVPIGFHLVGSRLSENKLDTYYLHSDHPKCQCRLYENLGVGTKPKIIRFDPSKMVSLRDIMAIKGRSLEKPKYCWTWGSNISQGLYSQKDEEDYFYKLNELKGSESPPSKLSDEVGSMLEDLVYQRTVNYFKQNKAVYKNVVKEVVCRAKFKTASTTESDLDVGIALVNGTVLNLECKSGNVKRKDLQSRIVALRRASSNIAELIMVLPFPADDQSLQKKQIEQHKTLKHEWNLSSILFTPYNSGVPSANEKSSQESFEDGGILPFEEALAQVLKKYLPD